MHAYGTTKRLGWADEGKALIKSTRRANGKCPSNPALVRTLRKQRRAGRQYAKREIARQLLD